MTDSFQRDPFFRMLGLKPLVFLSGGKLIYVKKFAYCLSLNGQERPRTTKTTQDCFQNASMYYPTKCKKHNSQQEAVYIHHTSRGIVDEWLLEKSGNNQPLSFIKKEHNSITLSC